MKKRSIWAWFWIILGFIYFFLPLYATFVFSLKAKKGVLTFLAYQRVLSDPKFLDTFLFSIQMAVLTIVVSLIIIVPTAYWINLKLPKAKPYVEFVTVLPFVIPAVVLVFGLIKTFSSPPFQLTSSWWLLVFGYVVLSLPYMYRSVDAGLRSMDVKNLTEAAQSLGANWITILLRVIFPNLRVAILSGTFLTFAIVIGELTLASLLAWPALGPYMAQLTQDLAYEPAALAIMSFAVTWGLIGLIQLISRGLPGQNQVGGTH